LLIVRGVNVFPSAIEGIVREFSAVDEFLLEVYKRAEMDELRLLIEVNGAPDAIAGEIRERLRARVGIRVEVVPAPAGSLPRYELKAKRVVRLTGEAERGNPGALSP